MKTEAHTGVGSHDLLSDDPVKQLCAFLRENKIGVVFWVCPKGCNGRVKWNAEKTDATCQVCGCKKSDNDRDQPRRD